MNTCIKKLIVFNFCTNTGSTQVLSHQEGKYSISPIAEIGLFYDGKELKKNTKRIKETVLPEEEIYANSGLTFLDRIQKTYNSKYEFDLFKINYCSIDGYDSVNRERKKFSINF